MGWVKEHYYKPRNRYGLPMTLEEHREFHKQDDDIDNACEECPETLIQNIFRIANEATSWTMRLNPDSRTGFEILMLENECPLEGLVLPEERPKFLRVINTSDMAWKTIKRLVVRHYTDYTDDPKKLAIVASIFSPAFGYKKQDAYLTTFKNLARDYFKSEVDGGSTFSIKNHAFKPEHFAPNQVLESFVPPLDWFPEELKQVKFADIFSIVSTKPELEVLELFFGRVALGANKFTSHDEIISHDFRTIAMVQSSAGCGKSKFVEYLTSAMTKLGLVAEAMQDPSARFNQANALLANLAIADDSGEKKVLAFTQNPLIKSCATGSPIRVEEKGIDARTIVPNAAILAFLNDIPLKILRSSDSGNADRIALIKSDSQNRLRDVSKVSPILEGVQSRIIPATTLHICNKLGISTDVLYAYTLRICLDKFLSHYSVEHNAYLVNDYIRKQKQYFSLVVNAEYRQAFLNYCLLADSVLYTQPIEGFNTASLTRAVRSGAILALSEDDWAVEIKAKLEADYQTCHYGATHWFAGLRDLGKGFYADLIERIGDLCQDVHKKKARVPNANDAITALFKGTVCKNGTLFEHTASEFILFFTNALEDLEIEYDRIAEYKTYLEKDAQYYTKGRKTTEEYVDKLVETEIHTRRETASAHFHKVFKP